MLPKIKLVGYTRLDVRSLAYDLNTVLGRCVTTPIDARGADPETVASFIVLLSESLMSGQVYHKALRNPGSALRHFSFTFLVVDQYDLSIDLYNHTSLACNSVVGRQGIVTHFISGNLEQWRTALINCASEIVPYSLRVAIDACINELNKLGLSDIWLDLKRIPLIP